jgi:23S rRNA (adenine2503-C2)-methyltransferase
MSTEEIISQVLIVKDYFHLWDSSEERLSNIVFMGMGEPLFNHENVMRVIENLMDDKFEGISRRKITLSTSGVSPILMELAPSLKCRLAISLHAPNDEIRSRIMPLNDTYNIESIINACKEYTKYHEYLRVTLEYLLLDSVNDSDDCAHQLLEMAKCINAKVNILQFNSWDGCSFKPSPQKTVRRFSEILEDGGIEAPIRTRRGEDIMAACGQLVGRIT